ncbi:MAG: helix-turn-helix transcriptional regulator, partial [Prevotella sp.]|nr:helix-turn-helix transcriptional regulator [Prevotella sp.]
GMAVCTATRSDTIPLVLYAYYLFLIIGIIIYMVRETRQYGRWLRDNYADLEHKEVWQSLVVLAIILLAFCFYAFELHSPFYKYATQVNETVLTCFLVWRVETISNLSSIQPLFLDTDEESDAEGMTDAELSPIAQDKIGLLLQRHCIDTQLYLQNDLNILQLAKAIGTNRFYLSQYFSRQGTTYNAYINGLRIDHFVRLYSAAITTRRTFTAQQLAKESGYRSYSTFGIAFKQRMGQTVTAWMRDTAKKPTV